MASLILGQFEKADTAEARKKLLEAAVKVVWNGMNDGKVRIRRMLPALGAALEGNETVALLDLSGNEISDADCKALGAALATNKGLRTLVLRNNLINTRGCQVLCAGLARNTGLETLVLDHNRIGPGGCAALLQALVTNTSLKRLSLRDNGIAPVGCQALGVALETSKSLEMLDLQDNGIGHAGCKALCKALAGNETLKRLDLGGNKVGKAGCKELCKALKTNKGLKELILQSNNIGGDGCKDMCEMLQTNKTLVTLILKSNDFGDEGCKTLCEGLAGNDSLQALDLSDNSFGILGCQALGLVLKDNKALQKLVLTGFKYAESNIDDEGCKILAEALRDNKTLQTLVLTKTLIGRAGCAALCEALMDNTSLRELHLDDVMRRMGLEGRNVFQASLPFLSLRSLSLSGMWFGMALESNFVMTNVECGEDAERFVERNKELAEQDAVLTLCDGSELPTGVDLGHVKALIVHGLSGTLDLSAAEMPALFSVTVTGCSGSRIVLPAAPLEQLHVRGPVDVRPGPGVQVQSLVEWLGDLGPLENGLRTLNLTRSPSAARSLELQNLPGSLERLHVRGCGITEAWLAEAIAEAPQLRFLDIGDNTGLAQMPEALKLMPLELCMDGTPFFRALPYEVLREGRSLADGPVVDPKCKVLLLGHDGVGKTTLADAIVPLRGLLIVDKKEREVELVGGVLSWNGKPQASVAKCDISPDKIAIARDPSGLWSCKVPTKRMVLGRPAVKRVCSLQSDRYETLREWVYMLGRHATQAQTLGVSVRPWTTAAGASVRLWDPSGRDAGQLLLSPRAVAVAVWSMSPGREGGRAGALEELGHWLGCVRQRAGEDARLLVVGTHKDEIQDGGDTADSRRLAVQEKLKESGWDAADVPVLEVGLADGAEAVREALEQAVSDAVKGKKIPRAFGIVQEALALIKEQGKAVVPLATIAECAGVAEDLCRRALQNMCDGGETVLLSDAGVILDPEWLAGALAGLGKHADQEVDEAGLGAAWAAWSTEHEEWVPIAVALLVERGLLEKTGEGRFLVRVREE